MFFIIIYRLFQSRISKIYCYQTCLEFDVNVKRVAQATMYNFCVCTRLQSEPRLIV
jgi:hypothetical protein